ncbi:hypothetical protein GE265_35225 (plasmid) [Streptomyces clavuligerus]|nr:hypothetical protein GE265_35225 [Streptomyces clavuligerus]
MIMLFSFTCIRLGLRWSGAGVGVQRYRVVQSLWVCGRLRYTERAMSPV